MILPITSLAATFLFLIFSILRSRTGALNFNPTDLTICAAHSDDCVIMGAEMAHHVLGAGHSVNIVYLTCSGCRADTDIAKERAEEARIAWEAIGVSAERLHFLDLPESPIGGLPRYGLDEIDRAKNWLISYFGNLSSDSIILIPAEGESHIDHRTMRRVSLRALEEAGKAKNVNLYEVTEYNTYLSMLQDPLAVLNNLILHIPLLGRVVPRRRAAPCFISGPPGKKFHNPSALATKVAMLGAFRSQDPALLRRCFNFPSRYRKVKVPVEVTKSSWTRHIDFLCMKADLSVLVFCTLVLSSMFGIFLEISKAEFLSSTILLVGLAGLLAISIRCRRYPFASLCGAACAGLLVGLV